MAFLKKAFLIFTCFLFPYYVSSGVIGSNNTISCDFFEPGDCLNCTDPITGAASIPRRIEQCGGEPSTKNYCFASWKIDDVGQVVLEKKGCFNTTDKTCKSTCVSQRKKKANMFYYCCCDTDQCNINFSIEASSPSTSKPQVNESTSATDSTPPEVHVLVILTCSILIFALLYSLYSFRKRKLCYFNRNSQFDQRSQTDSSSIEKLLPIELLVKKAEGRFGEVWKATYKPKNELLVVAVKIVPAQFKSSWSTELEVFRALQSGHENILQFYGAEKHYDGSHPKYWLITSYHERGSLCEHLKNNTLTYEQACSISHTMVRGLDYLHDEIFDKLHECSKPAVAHRDFKSNNVLLKDDFTACIADFGLAIIFKNSQFDDSNHGQVGTRRYMAPEVLQGSITFSIAAFQRIDMYACGLVLWEILSRCTAHEHATAKYRLPFEDELGEHPTIEQMLEVVVQQKKRPEIKESWENNPLLTNICKTIEDCWEAEPEARVSASLVVERFFKLVNPSTKCETEASLLPDT